MRHRSRPLATLTLMLATVLATTLATALSIGAAAAEAPADVRATVTGLRSSKGKVMACLTARPSAFPKCERDPDARSLVLPAAPRIELDFGPVPSGRYAISLIHDENANGRLDTRLVIPREGFGFSRDAPVRMGPPSFDAAAFRVDGGDAHLTIRMRYLL
ncbi:MAG TPA: DUF2141 domain-containing protein [Novosphingobium sp.]|nr:DUF2141 domain-containing protein [Novosphingobium sp.]